MSRATLVSAFVTAVLLTAAAESPAQSRRERRDRPDGGVERESPGTRPAGAGTVAPAGGSRSPGRPATMEDDFKVLLDRSIFARTGTAAAVSRPPSTTSTAPSAPRLSPEQAVVFIGVIAQDDEYVAFAENQETRQIMILRNGDDVARGKVVAITLDTIAYGTGGTIKEVHLGQNLAGELVNSSFTAGGSYAGTTGAPATSPATAAPSTAGMTPEQAAVLERLRQRRQRGE